MSWWMVRDHLLKRVRFGTPAPDLHLYSDAFRSGWGAHLLDRSVFRVWSEEEREVAAHQSSLNEGDVSDIVVISGDGRRVTTMCDNDGCGLRQQAGRNSVPLPLLVGQSPSEVDGEY